MDCKILDSKFYEKLLAIKDPSIKVTKVSIKAKNNEKVDHYGSDMIRILVKYTTTSSKDQELNLIVKQIPLEDGLKKTTLEKSKVFDVEVKVYSELQSIFQKYLDDSKIDTKLFCKCLYASLNPQPMLIFEDLTYEGFKRITKRSGNLEIALKALEKIAIWHAVSFKANGDGQKICQEFMDGFFKKDEWKNIPLFRDGPSFFLEMLKSHSEFEKYVSKFECLIQENPFSKVQKGFKSTEASLNVLNIGDIHYGNLMYSKDDVMLFDYQLVFWGPAVYDLIYVLYMYIDGGDRITRRDEIIYKYFETFTDTLKSMKYTGVYPRLTDLYKDFAISKDFEIMMMTSFLPISLVKDDLEDIDLHSLMTDDNARKKLYGNEVYLKEVAELLPFFLHRGYLD